MDESLDQALRAPMRGVGPSEVWMIDFEITAKRS